MSERKLNDESWEKPQRRGECIFQGWGVNIVFQKTQKYVRASCWGLGAAVQCKRPSRPFCLAEEDAEANKDGDLLDSWENTSQIPYQTFLPTIYRPLYSWGRKGIDEDGAEVKSVGCRSLELSRILQGSKTRWNEMCTQSSCSTEREVQSKTNHWHKAVTERIFEAWRYDKDWKKIWGKAH